MSRRKTALMFLAAGLLLFAACNSGPSGSGPSPAGRDEAARIARRIEHIERLLARRAEAADALDALTAVLPGQTRLVEVAYDPEQIRVKGRAATNDLLAEYITRLGESPTFMNLTLGGSVMRTVRGREVQEFAFDIALVQAGVEAAPTGAAAAARLRELEKSVPARPDTAGTLREIQRLALDAGLQMTTFVPGAEVPGEFTTALPVTIEVAGGLRSLGRCLRGLADSPDLWVVDKLSLRATAPDDPRSEYRASITARAYFAP